METVTHHGRATAYRSRGPQDAAGRADGRSLLFVHGSGGTHAVWKAQLSRLAGPHRITALDLAGHGESDDVETDPGPATLDAYVHDTLAVAVEVDADVLVGNSLGGAVVLTALLDHDAAAALDLDGVVLVGSGAKLAVHRDVRDWLADDWDRVVEFLHGPDRFFHDVDDRYVELSRQAMEATGRSVTRRDFRSCHTFDVRDRLDEIRVPLLAFTGEHDELTPPAYHEYLADAVPSGEWTTIGDAAHLSMLEAPATCNETLAGWLDGL